MDPAGWGHPEKQLPPDSSFHTGPQSKLKIGGHLLCVHHPTSPLFYQLFFFLISLYCYFNFLKKEAQCLDDLSCFGQDGQTDPLPQAVSRKEKTVCVTRSGERENCVPLLCRSTANRGERQGFMANRAQSH